VTVALWPAPLLSVQLTILHNEPRDLEYVQDQLKQYISDLGRLSGDVRRISHELHPAILSQLGLEASLHNFCVDLAAAEAAGVVGQLAHFALREAPLQAARQPAERSDLGERP